MPKSRGGARGPASLTVTFRLCPGWSASMGTGIRGKRQSKACFLGSKQPASLPSTGSPCVCVVCPGYHLQDVNGTDWLREF